MMPSHVAVSMGEKRIDSFSTPDPSVQRLRQSVQLLVVTVAVEWESWMVPSLLWREVGVCEVSGERGKGAVVVVGEEEKLEQLSCVLHESWKKTESSRCRPSA